MVWHGRYLLCLFAILCVGVTASCAKGTKTTGEHKSRTATDSTITAVALPEYNHAEPKFVALSLEESGIDFVNEVSDPRLMYEGGTLCQGGAATGDIDADGDLDVFMSSINGVNKLFRNEGSLKFKDITAEAGEGLAGVPEQLGCGALFADLDCDSRLDLYICDRHGPNRFYKGDGEGHFKLVQSDKPVSSPSSSVMAAAFDADNDGDLDLYLANYRGTSDPEALQSIISAKKKRESMQSGVEGQALGLEYELFNIKFEDKDVPEDLKDRFYVYPNGKLYARPHDDQFFVNDGKGNFTDKTEEAGLKFLGWSFQPQACDFNNDGWTDLYVTCDFETQDRYFINNQDGTFSDRTTDMVRIIPMFSMGADTGDINNDGLPDLFAVDMLSRSYKRAKTQSSDMRTWRWELMFDRPQPQMRNMLYLNRGEGWLTEVGQYASVQSSEWSWATRFVDLNGDGREEIFVTNGMLYDDLDVDARNERARMSREGASPLDIVNHKLQMPPLYTDDIIFTSEKDLDYKPAEGNWGLLDQSMATSCVCSDLDGDADIDILLNNTNKPSVLYRNDVASGNRVLIDLRMPGTGNHEAVGSRVWAHCGDRVLTRDVILARGFASGDSSRIHMALGEADKIDRLVIRWPDSTVQEYSELAANNHFTITKDKNLPAWESPRTEAMFASSRFDWVQSDKDLGEEEFDKEPLLPIRQSSLGTGAGMADVNGDGMLDIYFAGAKDQLGQLYLGAAGGKFTKSDMLSSLSVAEQEEMSVLWFDCDGDGDQDLLLTSGGTEAPKGSMVFQPRLLMNNGGSFAEGTLPARRESTGHAAAADIDNDGDLDLLLAGHVVPNSFSSIAPSQFLKNEGSGNFTDATAQFAPGFKPGGQITEAQFADIDGDGWQDLVCSTFWGSVEYYRNQNGVLSAPQKLTKTGWWRSLGIGDYDNDGDLDILAGNISWNTKYHPKEGKPTTLFAADFDDNGTRDTVEVKHGDNGMLPGRGRSCSGFAIGYIPQKWPTWESFAEATLEEVYGHKLKSAERYDADIMRSQYIVNNGDSFEARDLPLGAQLAPVFGIAVGDYNNDGNLDAFMANNFYWPQCEAGNWQEGYGTLMLGDGKGEFRTLEPGESGSWVYDDMRSAIPVDINADGLLDVVLSSSAAAPQMLVSRKEGVAQSGGSGLSVRLEGKAPNTAAVGARLMLSLDNGTVLTRLVQAGNGYLGSYSGPVHFGVPAGAKPQRLTVIWPDGSTQDVEQFDGQSVTVTQ